MHKSWAIIKLFKGSISERIAIGTAKRAIRANIIAKLGTIPADEALQNWLIRLKDARGQSAKLCFPPKAGSTFSQNGNKSNAKMPKFRIKCIR